MEMNSICKTLKVFYVLAIVVFCTFLVSFVFNFEVCYNFLCNNILEELSFKNFIKIHSTLWGDSFFGFFAANITNIIIFIVGFILTLPIQIMLLDKTRAHDASGALAEAVVIDFIIAVLFYFPFKVLLLGLAYALTFFATNAGIIVLFLWLILICICCGVLYRKLKEIANDLIIAHLGKLEFTYENYGKFCPEFVKIMHKIFRVNICLFIACSIFIVFLFV